MVDCDEPVPSSDRNTRVKRNVMERHIFFRLMKSCPAKGENNIIIGVTRENISDSDAALKIIMHLINIMCHCRVFKNYSVLNAITGKIEAGLNSPPDIQGELHILSKRPRTCALFKDKKCWWNEHSKLKRHIEKFSKHVSPEHGKYREGY